MRRTTLMLPDDLKERAQSLAKRRRVSFGELVRRLLWREVDAAQQPDPADPFFADTAVWEGPTPGDVAERHDDYLYGDD
jgi:hypothetical protein